MALSHRMNRKRIIRIGIIFVCIYLIFSSIAGVWELLRANDKVTLRENELARLNRKHDELVKQKAQIDGQDYLESVAYDKLGMTRPGERIVVLPEGFLERGNLNATSTAVPNWKKWQKLFF